MSKRFCLVFTHPFTQVHLAKDTGKIPEVIARRLGWEANILRCSGDPTGDLEASMREETPHVHLHTVTGHGDGRIEKSILRFLWQHARSIDVLMVMHYGKHTSAYGALYKAINPKGFLWNKLDLHEQVVRIYDFAPRRITFGRRGVRDWLQRRFVESVDLISTETECSRRILVERFPWLAEKLAVVPCGVDVPCMPEVEIGAPRERLILNVARVGTEQKATDVLLEAFARSELWSDWQLALVGPVEPAFRPWLEAYATRHPEAWNAVHLVGPIASRREMAKWYARAAVFCLPSRYESWGLALSEAGFYGCACVSTNFEAAIVMLDGGRCGALCPKDDAGELASQLRRVCNSQHLIGKYGQEFRRRVLEQYNWDRIIDEWSVMISAR